MKRTTTLFTFIAFLITTITLYAQDTDIVYQNTIGGNHSDFSHVLKETTDGGYILGGYSLSDVSGDKTDPSNGTFDMWVVKIDEAGDLVWENSIGGAGEDVIYSIELTSDGGYILAGQSSSGISGDKTEVSRGSEDFWIVKINSLGAVEWDKTYGGLSFEWDPNIVETSGGYFICGYSSSGNSGDKTEDNIGLSDFWLLKIDNNGNILFQDTIGGTKGENFGTIISTQDGGCMIGGSSTSDISGDKTENNRGNVDYWIVKIDTEGAIEWDKTIGGIDQDILESMVQTNDGGFVILGSSKSNISGDKTENSQGNSDYWVVKTDANGTIEWQNTIGGSILDEARSIFQTNDGGYLLGGISYSNISGDKMENSNGAGDYWIVKINVNGTVEWDKTLGGSGNDTLTALLQINDGSLLLGGGSNSNISGDKTEDSQGELDFWVLKLNGTLGVNNNELAKNLAVFPNPAKNTLQLNTNNQQIDKVKIFSAKGDLVQQVEGFETSTTIDVSQLASGMYYIQFTAGKQIATKKFIKQ